MSFVIPKDELTLSEMKRFRTGAKEKAIQTAVDLAIGPREGLVARGIFPGTDLGVGANGYTNEVFLTGAVVANTWTSVYDTGLVPQLSNRTILVIYKIVNMTAIPQITAVRFRLGVGGTSMLAWVQVEQVVDVGMTPECYLSEPVVYTKDQWADIQCYARAAIPAAGERLGFGGYVVEPIGETIS